MFLSICQLSAILLLSLTCVAAIEVCGVHLSLCIEILWEKSFVNLCFIVLMTIT